MKALFPSAVAACLWLAVLPPTCRAQTPESKVDRAVFVQAVAYVDGHLKGKDAGTTMQLFSTADYNTGKSFVRNAKLWCGDLDFTCFSAWNSTEHNMQGGTLITRRHVLLANHFSNPYTGTPPMLPGLTKMVFVARDSTIHTRTVSRLTGIPGTDLLIGTLDSDLPDKITPAQIFPAGRGHALMAGTPLIYTGQDKLALVAEGIGVGGLQVAFRSAAVGERPRWTTPGPARVGDSGSPVFVPVGGRAVLLCHLHFANGGPSTGRYIAEINGITGPGIPSRKRRSPPSWASPDPQMDSSPPPLPSSMPSPLSSGPGSIVRLDQGKIDREHLRLLVVFHAVLALLSVLIIGFLLYHRHIMHMMYAGPRAMRANGQVLPPEVFVVLDWCYLGGSVLCVLSGVFNALSARCIRRRTARTFSQIVAGLDCLQFPYGTVLGVFTLTVLQRPSVRDIYAARPPATATPPTPAG